jgi:hypothetical protein
MSVFVTAFSFPPNIEPCLPWAACCALPIPAAWLSLLLTLPPALLLPSCLSPCRLHRNILADKPRVTKFNIDWDSAREASGLQSGMEVDS